jgi:7-cyano-7-deazaguanine synthase
MSDATLFDLEEPIPEGWPDRRRMLLSYAYAERMTAEDFAELSSADLIIDSGAFTALNSGTPVDHDAYLDWLTGHASSCRFAFSLDVIGDWRASLQNYLYGRDRLGDAVRLVPTWHIGSPWEALHELCELTDYVGIGGAVPFARTPALLFKLARQAHEIAASHGTRLHGLGITGRRVMFHLPWASVDSSSWNMFGRFSAFQLAESNGRLTPVVYGTGDPLTPELAQLTRQYGLDPTRMHEPGYGSSSKGWESTEYNLQLRFTNRVATARSFMYAEAVKRSKHPDSDFRLYLACDASDNRELRMVRAAHRLGNPWTVPTTTTTQKGVTLMNTESSGTGSNLAVITFSGGMDSTTLATRYHRLGYDLLLLSVDYGQRHATELEHAAAVAERLEAEHLVVDARGIGALLSGSALTDSVDVPEGHYTAETMTATVVPNRNAILANIAVGVAVARRAELVALGVHSGDHAIYPDCRPEFVTALRGLVHAATEGLHTPRIEAPFLNISKAEIAELAGQIGAPLELSWSCYRGGERHCGRCGTCVERAEAFALAGLDDPTDYEDAEFWRSATSAA